jgi:rod shape-determining protein MreD
MEQRVHGLVILATVLLALALAIVPLPGLLTPLRPDWVALVMIYWMLTNPGRFSMLSALFLGLLLDTLSGALLGQHGLAMLVIAYFTQSFSLRIRVFPVIQMSLTVMVLIIAYQFFLFWIDGITGRQVPLIDRWAPAVSAAFVWPLILASLDGLRRETQTRM